MGFHVLRAGELDFAERASRESEPPRSVADVTTAASLTQSRARVWRYPPGTHGRRHQNSVQEEVFVVLSGTLTLALGEPPERVEAPAGSVVAVETGTPLQLANESDGEVVLFAYGAPPATDQATMLDDVL